MIITIINSNEWTSFSPYFHKCTTHVNNPSSLSQLVSTTEFICLSYAPRRYLLPGPTDIRLGQVTSFDQRNKSRSDITLAPRRSFNCHLWFIQVSLFFLCQEDCTFLSEPAPSVQILAWRSTWSTSAANT